MVDAVAKHELLTLMDAFFWLHLNSQNSPFAPPKHSNVPQDVHGYSNGFNVKIQQFQCQAKVVVHEPGAVDEQGGLVRVQVYNGPIAKQHITAKQILVNAISILINPKKLHT